MWDLDTLQRLNAQAPKPKPPILPEEPQAYQWALPESLGVPADELQVRLDFHHQVIVMYVIEKGVITTKLVSAQELTQAFLSRVRLSSGFLPEGALWWSQDKDGPIVALWRSPRMWKVAIMLEAFKAPLRLHLPMPGLIFLCQAMSPPMVYAAQKRPQTGEDMVYHAPLFNVFRNGRSCPGTHHYPGKIEEVPESFFTSFFSPAGEHKGRSKKYPDDLLKLWQELDGKKRYPLDDLMPLGKVEEIM